MVDPYVGEIRTVGFNFAPQNWALCNGQVLLIRQNTPLFSVLGTTYGGDGETTFGLPNLNRAFVIGAGAGPGLSPRDLGEIGGTESVTLNSLEMPAHSHQARAVAAPGNSSDPTGRTWAQPRMGRVARAAYDDSANSSMSPLAVSVGGGGQPHGNMPPYLGMYYMIALTGVFPPRP